MLYNLKNIFTALCCSTEETETSSALAYALSLAQEAGARLTVQASAQKLSLPHTRVSATIGGLVAAENERLAQLAGKLADDARAAAELGGVAVRTEVPLLPHLELVERFVAEARVHDLTVVDAESSALSPDRALIEAALFQSGRPLLIVPEGHPVFRGRRILVAWDGSARVARAVNEALPLLRAAAMVEVLSIIGEKDLSKAVPGAGIAPHLSAHGVTFELKEIAAPDGDAGEALRLHAVASGADLIVMGAYAHSWLRQITFGGVTQSLLRAAPLPLFLSY